MNHDGTPPRPHLRPVLDEPPFDPDHDRPSTTAPPADRAAERALLATLIHEPETATLLDQLVTTEDFYWPAHANLWDAWHHLATTDAVPPDLVTLNAHLVRTRDTDGVRLLTDLTGAGTPGMGPEYARIVAETSRLRTVDNLATGLRQLVNTARVDHVGRTLEEALDRIQEAYQRPWANPADQHALTGRKDLAAILHGTAPEPPKPTWVRRNDGTALFYAGKVNGIFGDPEAAKTWLAQIAIVEALRNPDGRAAMIDVDHNGPDHTAARLLLLGARLDDLADPARFRYYEPEDADELRAAVNEICTWAPHVLLVDSLGEVFPMLGVKTNDSDELTSAMRLVCTKPALAGACVITIDHLPKSTEARATGFAIGSIAKKRMIRGAYLRAEARQQPTPGGIGRITLRIEKDTTGELRRSSGGGYAGTFVLDSTLEHTTTWEIGRDQVPKNDDGTFRPTSLMERISRFIEDNDQCTFTDIKDAVQGKDKWLRDAIGVLVTEGFVARIAGARRAQLHHSIAPYRQTEDDHVQGPDTHLQET